jgi:hypothetical protein
MARVTLSKASVEDLRNEIQRRQAALPGLIAQRDELNRQIEELQALGLPGAAATARKAAPVRSVPAKGWQARNKLSLPQLLRKILEGKPEMSVNELTAAAVAAGYKSNSKAFKAVVRQTLYQDKRFERVGRGRFAGKG